MASAALAAKMNTQAFGTTAPAASSFLRLTPPKLTSPTVHIIPPGGANLALGAGDHILQLPNTAVTNTQILTNRTIITVDGKNLANNIVVVGGKLQANLCYNPATMRLLQDNSFAVYSTVGFTGAKGGTFTINCNQNKTVVTAPIPYNATPAMILAAMNAALGHPNATFAVSGAGVGGPWQIVPGNNGATGRCSINPAGLIGSPVVAPATYTYNATMASFWIKDFLGCFHVEGIHIDNTLGADAFDIQTPYETASVQLANCHFRSQCEPFHSDWVHPDGLQAYLGPAKLFAQNCDFITKGGNAFIGQPRHTAAPIALQALWDWWFMNCQFRSYETDDVPYTQTGTAGGTGAYQETDWPLLNGNEANWTWQMQNCYGNKFSSLTGRQDLSRPLQDSFNAFITTAPTHFAFPTGITLNTVPAQGLMCDPAQGQCGIGYTTPGYVGGGQPTVTKRLEGATKLT